MSLVLPRPCQTGMTRRARRLWFFTLYVVGCASVATATGYVAYPGSAPLRIPQAVQIVLGLLMVFVVPGLSLVFAALPERQSWVERLLASVGISVAVATCATVVLAATPMGFSRQPFGELLGGIAIVLSVGGLYRSSSAAAVWEPHAWTKKISIGRRRGAQRPDNPAKSQQRMETDVRRSVVVLRIGTGSDSVEPRA
jgi:hypothetical protein